MSQAGHLECDPKVNAFLGSGMAGHKTVCFPGISKIPQQSQVCTPRGKKSKGGKEVAKKKKKNGA